MYIVPGYVNPGVNSESDATIADDDDAAGIETGKD
jgi:hypothetical protein